MQNLVNIIDFVRIWAGVDVMDEDGQGLVEYVLIIALIAIVVVGGFAAVSTGLTGKIGQITTLLGGTAS